MCDYFFSQKKQQVEQFITGMLDYSVQGLYSPPLSQGIYDSLPIGNTAAALFTPPLTQAVSTSPQLSLLYHDQSYHHSMAMQLHCRSYNDSTSLEHYHTTDSANGVLLSPESFQSADSFDLPATPFSYQMPSHQDQSYEAIGLPKQPYYSHRLIHSQNYFIPQYQQPQQGLVREVPQAFFKDIQRNQKAETQRSRKVTKRKRATTKQLECPVCFKVFSRPFNLKSHQRTHTKERPFACTFEQCEWSFARPHDLKRHQILHSGVKPFVCSCGKGFARSDAFKRHQLLSSDCIAVITPSSSRKSRS